MTHEILNQIALYAPYVGSAVILMWTGYVIGKWHGRRIKNRISEAERRELWAMVPRERSGRFAKRKSASSLKMEHMP